MTGWSRARACSTRSSSLHAEGRRLGVVTAKRRATLELAFEVLPELRRFFEVTVAAEDTERHKPNPDPLLLALERLGESADGAVYVGDSPFDVQAAKAAGAASIAVTWGRIHSRERLEREDARRRRRNGGGAACRPLRRR